MSYTSLMRNAAKILFAFALIVFIGTALFSILAAGRMGDPTALAVGLGGAFSAAIPAFVGAAIIWRLDIWLFERGERP